MQGTLVVIYMMGRNVCIYIINEKIINGGKGRQVQCKPTLYHFAYNHGAGDSSVNSSFCPSQLIESGHRVYIVYVISLKVGVEADRPVYWKSLKLEIGSLGGVVRLVVAHISTFVRSRGLKKRQVAHR
jgi:hypothetical protein